MKLLIVVLCCVGYAIGGKTPKPITLTEVENRVGLTHTDDGEALVEGDMVITKAGSEGSDRNAIGEQQRWIKKGNFVEIPYTYAGSLTSKARKMVEESIADYAAFTCIKFVPRSSQPNYIEFFKGGGCFSSVGMTGGKQVLSLGNGCDATKGIATHEMMHAIGFTHEQSRNDRDNYVSIIYDNIVTNGIYNFHKCNGCKDPTGLGYDYNSIMHYGATAFTKNQKDTIIPKQRGAKIGQRGGLCDMDIKKLNWMYKCNGWTVSRSKPNGGIVPCKQTYDLWANCADFAYACKNNAQVQANCMKYCASH